MTVPSPETPKQDRDSRLRDMLDMNRKVCRELREAVENCVSKGNWEADERTEKAPP